jgi:hypothetical protein
MRREEDGQRAGLAPSVTLLVKVAQQPNASDVAGAPIHAGLGHVAQAPPWD